MRTKLIRDLIRESHYVVDEDAVAEAIMLRARARRVVPHVTFRNTTPALPVRSFRRHRAARSFRLVRPEHPSPQQ